MVKWCHLVATTGGTKGDGWRRPHVLMDEAEMGKNTTDSMMDHLLHQHALFPRWFVGGNRFDAESLPGCWTSSGKNIRTPGRGTEWAASGTCC